MRAFRPAAAACALALLCVGAGKSRADGDGVFQECCNRCQASASYYPPPVVTYYAPVTCYAEPACPPKCGPIRRLLRRCCGLPTSCACKPAPCPCPPPCPAPCPPAALTFHAPGSAVQAPPVFVPPAPAPLPVPEGRPLPPSPEPPVSGSAYRPQRPLAPVPAQRLTPPMPPAPVRLDRVASTPGNQARNPPASLAGREKPCRD